MEVAVTAVLPGTALDHLAARAQVRVRRERMRLSPAALAAFIGAADAAITLLADPVDGDVLTACPGLKVVANYAVGVDNIDLETARTRGVWVTNTPDVLTEATADLTWTLILGITRRVLEGDALMRAGHFDGWRPDLLLGTGLQDKTLGIIGYGRIGRAVARRGIAFGMEIATLARPGRTVTDPPSRLLPFEELLAASDVLSLHCPLTRETRHLLDESHLRMLPRGAFLINTARGPVIDEAALARVLADGHLAGVALDVYEHEPEVHPDLARRRDVLLMPHAGSATVETRSAMADLAVANVEAVFDGREPPTPVVRGNIPGRRG